MCRKRSRCTMICKALIALLTCVGVMAGCANAIDSKGPIDIEPVETARTEFTKEELLADYDRLWEMLEEDYIYFPVLESRGVDVSALKETARQQLSDRVTTLNGFYYLLDDVFGKMQYFAHLGLVTPDAFAVYQKYYNEGNDTNGWQIYLRDPQTNAVYAYLNGTLSSGWTSSGGDVDGPREVEAAYDADRKAVTFVITTFSDAVLERDSSFVSDYLISLGDVEIDHIIFDISGNGGGTDLYWRDNIVAPFGGTYEWLTYLYLRDTSLTRNYFFPYTDPKPVSEISNHILPDFVEELELTHFIGNEARLSNEATLGENALAAKRWVIIDERVYSAADSFGAFCKATGWATLVGQTTLGDGQGTSPVLIALPNTGLLVRFSCLAAETPDGTLNAVKGTAPDIPVDPSLNNPRDAIDQLIDDISTIK